MVATDAIRGNGGAAGHGPVDSGSVFDAGHPGDAGTIHRQARNFLFVDDKFVPNWMACIRRP